MPMSVGCNYSGLYLKTVAAETTSNVLGDFPILKRVGMKGSKITYKVDFCHLNESFMKSLSMYMLILIFP